MCARFTLHTSSRQLGDLFRLEFLPELPARYNIAPTQPIAVVRHLDGKRTFGTLRWGLIPSWAREAASSTALVNARCETVASKPSFRQSFQQRRCLIPADGFFEWRTEDGRKQPYYFTIDGGIPFAFAGVWDCWKPLLPGPTVESVALLTTTANATMAAFHERMPIIVSPADYERWLEPRPLTADEQARLFTPLAADRIRPKRVRHHVNKVTNEGPTCIEPLASLATPSLFDMD